MNLEPLLGGSFRTPFTVHRFHVVERPIIIQEADLRLLVTDQFLAAGTPGQEFRVAREKLPQRLYGRTPAVESPVAACPVRPVPIEDTGDFEAIGCGIVAIAGPAKASRGSVSGRRCPAESPRNEPGKRCLRLPTRHVFAGAPSMPCARDRNGSAQLRRSRKGARAPRVTEQRRLSSLIPHPSSLHPCRRHAWYFSIHRSNL